MTIVGHFISGARVAGVSGRNGDIFNPATGEKSGTVALASEAEVDQAVKAAQAAWPAWASTPPIRRARVIWKFKELVEARNHGEAMAHSAERNLKEHGDKVGPAERGQIEGDIQALRDAMKGENVEAIKAKTEQLAQSAMKLGEAAYKASQGGGDAGPSAGPGEAAGSAGAGSAGAAADEGVVDADFEEVKDEDKKGRAR